jgi:hypothetical protein
MSYSNGFDLAVVLPALKGRVGWQSDSPPVAFESFHALCTEQNLRDTQPTENISDSDFAAYKDQLEDQIIQRCLRSVFSRPEFLEQALLHNRLVGTRTALIQNEGLFCGLRFLTVPDFRISTWVKTVTLLFSEDVTFNLYLYQEGKAQPLKTQSVSALANTPTVVNLTDWILSYGGAQTAVFYVGYFQEDLGSAQAIREQVRYNKTMQFAATSVQAEALTATTFNQAEVTYDLDTVGLNAEVHAFRDYTLLVKRSPHLFDEVIGLSMVYFVVEQMLNTTRSNKTERKLQDFQRIELVHYLYGAVPVMGVAKVKGLSEVLQQKFSEIRGAFYPSAKIQTTTLC